MKKIYINEWLKQKPYKKQTATDGYYISLSNQVKQVFIDDFVFSVISNYEDGKGVDVLSVFLTSYFEDLISETNIWNSFVKAHKELYHKPLPFYSTEEYYEDEINVADIAFLIWYFLSTIQNDLTISPFADFILKNAKSIYKIFDDAWDSAPVNETLKAHYTIGENETDYYVARNFIDNILFKTYLFYPDTSLMLRDNELEIIDYSKSNDNSDQIVQFLNAQRDENLHRFHTKLLALSGKEWAVKILGDAHPMHTHFAEMSKKIDGHFFYKGQDEQNVFLEHIASGRQFNLTKKSFSDTSIFKTIGSVFYIGIVQWRSEWWFSGIYFPIGYDSKLVQEEKKSILSKQSVSFLDHQKLDVSDILNKQFTAFKMLTDGEQIAFLESNRMNEFIEQFSEIYNRSLKLSKRPKDKKRERFSREGLFGQKTKVADLSEMPENAAVFFNPKSGIEFALDCNSAFPLPHNPFFDIERSDEDVLDLIFSEQISTEFVMFCFDNFKNKLPFFNKPENQFYLTDTDFILRFSKNANYFTTPQISFV